MSFRLKMTKPEQKLLEIIEKNNLEFQYTGDGSFSIDGKIPDFLYTKKKKLLIEINGIVWHDKQSIRIKNKIYKRNGYQFLNLTDKFVLKFSEKELVKVIKNFILKGEIIQFEYPDLAEARNPIRYVCEYCGKENTYYKQKIEQISAKFKGTFCFTINDDEVIESSCYENVVKERIEQSRNKLVEVMNQILSYEPTMIICLDEHIIEDITMVYYKEEFGKKYEEIITNNGLKIVMKLIDPDNEEVKQTQMLNCIKWFLLDDIYSFIDNTVEDVVYFRQKGGKISESIREVTQRFFEDIQSLFGFGNQYNYPIILVHFLQVKQYNMILQSYPVLKEIIMDWISRNLDWLCI